MNRALLILSLFLLASPSAVFAAATSTTPTTPTATTTSATTTPLEISGWIPYWTVYDGTRDATKHLDVLDEVSPFAYSVQPDGRLKDLANLDSSDWIRFFNAARKQDVALIPTVMWSDTTAMQDILSDPNKREDHERRIASMVKRGKYDGVDIDYEGKLASTRDDFSAFLKELKAQIGDKTLVCTIEARTPADSLYPAGKIPADLEYANDYTALNSYCDRVKLLTYDQQRADLKLDAARTGAPYYPVADIDWVRKVATLAVKDISPSKLILSVPTYGRELSVTVAPQWYKAYTQLWSVSPTYASTTAKQYAVTPSRNAAGEMSFSYLPAESTLSIPANITAPAGTASGNITAARALAYANASGQTINFNLVWWSDASAIAQKIALAKELGLRGVSLFKIDGAEDPALWTELAK